ncbi:2-hydroxyacid dehydrogenase [Amorphus sp. 3PC139-8]|uniref:2-hydroxyacid dehydrogenase n=1 Tax=Amorphus sp. 3PC139-8 TaxID=2735676 RepID=UPI00345DD569
MTQPTVLLLTPMLPVTRAALDDRFDLVALADAEDKEARLAKVADRVRAIAMFADGRVDGALMNRLPKLEIVSVFGVGYDGVDAAEAARRGILVTNTPDVLTDEVADTAMALTIMTVRRLGAAERYLRAGQWTAKGPFPLTPGSLVGATMGILGLGRIGRAVAARASAFGLKIAYHGRSRQDVPYAYYDSPAALAEASDILMIATPGGAETRHLVDADVLKALGSRGYLVNIGRGSTVDETALAAALEAGTIAGAGLDVFAEEPQVPEALLGRDDVVLLPHVASASLPTRTAMGQLMVDNLSAWFESGRVLTPVPETPRP